MPKYGDIWSFYLDTNIYNFLVQDPRGPAALQDLLTAKQNRRGYAYASLYNIMELAATYQGNSTLAVQLLTVLRRLAYRRGLNDTPEILRAEVRHLRDHSVQMELIKPRDSEYTRRYFQTLDDLIDRPSQNTTLYREMYDDVRRRKRQTLDNSREARRQFAAMIGSDPLPFAPNIQAYFTWARATNYFETITTGLRPYDMRNEITGAELLGRLDEMIGYRSMVYFMLSALGYQFFLRETTPDYGDAIDQHHGIYAGYFDIFVSNDEDCRKFATQGLRDGERVMSLQELLEFLR